MKINIFRGELSDISAKKEALMQVPRLSLRMLTQATRCALTALPATASNTKKVSKLVGELRAAVEMLLGAEASQLKDKKERSKLVRL